MKRSLPYLSVLFALLFAGITVAVVYHAPFIQPFDAAARVLAVPFQTSLGIQIFRAITYFGTTLGITLGAIFIVIRFRHRPDIIARMLIAILGMTVVGEYLKSLIARTRPPVLPGLSEILSGSFPSGHSYSSMVLYSYLALLLYIHGRTMTRRFVSVGICVLIILLIGFSRLVLNYHYASDVLGGYLLGLFWVTFSLSLPLHWALYHREAIHTEPVEKPLL